MKMQTKCVLALFAVALFLAAPGASFAQRIELIENGNLDSWTLGDPDGWDMTQADSSGNPGGTAVINEETVTVKSGSSMAIATGGGFTFRYVAHTSDWGAIENPADWTVSIFGLAGVDRTRVYVAVQTNGVGPFVTSFAAAFGGANGITTVADPPAGWNDYSGTFPAGTFTGGTNGTDRYRFTIHAIDAGSFVDNVSLSYIRDCAGPYAGLIAVNSTTVIDSEGTSITYVLPYDLNTTGTATINILNSSNAVVATFPGTTTSGLNIVDWDGTVDNAGGTPVAIGTGYKVRITVLNETAPGWYVANYNAAAGTGAPDGGPGTLFNGFSMTGAHAQTNKSSELFGLIHARNSFAPYGASILLRGDLQPLAGDGSANRVLRHPSEPAPGSGAQWGGSFLPDSDVVFMAGQTAPYITAGSGLSTNSTNVSTTYTVLTFGRDTKVVEENGTLWAYITAANSVIDKVEIDSNGFPTTNSINVLSPASLGVTLYSKDLEFDADGNLYYLGRNDTTVDAFVYRWDAADVQAITKPYHAPLTAGQATWVITHNSGSNQRGLGLGISCGKIYLACTNAATEVTFEMLEIGDVSTPTLTKTLAAGDIVLSSANRWADGVYGNLDPDGVGHLITHNRSPENVRLLAPGGLTQIVTTSPASQSFNIVSPPPLSVPDWFMHQ